MALSEFYNEIELQSVYSGKIYLDNGWVMENTDEQKPSLLRAIYKAKQINLKNDDAGLFRFSDWLPVKKDIKGSSAPITYKSEGLAKYLDLKNLYITFSGYWPEKGVFMKTCSFKETEAYSVCSRFNPKVNETLVVASAGNTARAFARVCSDNNINLLLCVPEDCCNALWFDEPLNDCVKLAVVKSGGDYYDAIRLSETFCKFMQFIPEGGAKNVARRDGMGTTVLSAATTIGRIPDYYFQAVGSGTGAIAAWEANNRLIGDGRFGNHKMKLLVSQNIPFVPMYEAWKRNSRSMLPLDDTLARTQIEKIAAKVLSNRNPPYSIIGGLYDALLDTDGDILIASNEEALTAADLFEETEGIDIHPAAAIATASLVNYLKGNKIISDAVVMLNITGGGEKKFFEETKISYLKPHMVFDFNPGVEDVERNIKNVFGFAPVLK